MKLWILHCVWSALRSSRIQTVQQHQNNLFRYVLSFNILQYKLCPTMAWETSLHISEYHIHWHPGPLRNHLRERVRKPIQTSLTWRKRLNTRRPTRGGKYMLFFHFITSCVIKTPVLCTINQQIYYSKDHFTQISWWFFFFWLKIKTSPKNIQYSTTYWEDKVI